MDKKKETNIEVKKETGTAFFVTFADTEPCRTRIYLMPHR